MKIKYFILLFILFSILCFVSFVIAFAFDEGTLGNDQLGLIGTYVFMIFYFPVNYFYYELLSGKGGYTFYVIGFLIDIAFWAFIFQLIFYCFRKT